MTIKHISYGGAALPPPRAIEIQLAEGMLPPVQVIPADTTQPIKAIWRNEIGTAPLTPALQAQ